ncbi:TPA: DHH family phosphoesterase [Streptococcus pyogenes]|uniref:Cyclic-di-AMP phosphodiesterase n=6 Tax=Streptococcus pyogenes TaxID=1314 RepID=Q99XI9_STRP1|nr:DHH family phosphoesterase [Streptococcus pyogenes]HEP6224445.1 DHH family phosphoesterase [Streptococcus pyogenes ABC020014327]HEP6227920.1 DHH family phosphoesterase [Streptococcus pyogenes ABC020056369]HEP6229507.1 DHH family phosphoesterase [Streptococcus pyogenes ABC020013891]HEP6231248.1 DHH family phosphoesterase [Streptococcus pyogenes ABC020041419]HEP6232927.1 DHH family phosphoesterase [Streptococcus pyogenes ABC020060258]HEP6239805.1 DHH family phosphoesterase [Streptococcus pyo
MKKFRFETIHLIMMGLILFGLLALCVSIMQSKILILLAIFLVLLFVVALLWYQKEAYQLSDLAHIELLNEQTEDNLKTLLDNMPVGVVQFDQETNAVEWYNPYAELIFTTEEGFIQNGLIQQIITEKRREDISQTFEVSGNKYTSYIDVSSGIFYFFDSFVGNRQLADASMLRPVVGIISVDNYDDITDDLSDADTSKINSFVANFIDEFMESKRIFYRRVNMDRYYFFTDFKTLNDLMDNKFSVLEEFRKEAQDAQRPLTLSIGISFGEENHSQIGQVALENLNIALVRGGDQIVIRENADHTNPIYFGGGSVSTVKRSRTRTRAMMTAISDRIKMVDNVFIVGHRKLDMDALGSAVGMQFFAGNIIENSFAVYNPDEMSPDIERAIERLQADGKTRLISVSQAMGLVTPRSLLVMVDHSKISLTLSKEFYEQFQNVIVVDHHRRDDDFPDNAILTFIESGASSAAELVTELIQFQNAKKCLNKIQASVLMAGIMLDTKNFSTRVTSRTFDVASYLRSKGSDSVEIQNISATDFEEYKQINEIILQGERLGDSIIVAAGEKNHLYSNVIASKAADTILSMAHVEASFVLVETASHKIAISARSRSKINVQRVMEKLGGGGHFNLAACQLTDISLPQAKYLLLKTINMTMKETGEVES